MIRNRGRGKLDGGLITNIKTKHKTEASKVPSLPRRRGRPPKNVDNSQKIDKSERNDRSAVPYSSFGEAETTSKPANNED